jgi:hypothetical protein
MVMQAVFHGISDLKCAFGTQIPNMKMKWADYVTVLWGIT